MRITKSMIYTPSPEATELTLYAENTREVYDRCTMPTINSLRKKAKKGLYDSNKAIEAWYHVTTAASKLYNKEFGHSFTVTERWTAAVDLEEAYRDEVFEEV